MKKTTIFMLMCILPLLAALGALAQSAAKKKEVDTAEVRALKSAVEKDITSLKAHEAYIKAAGVEDSQLKQQYEQWMKAYPHVAAIPQAYGTALADHEYPDAKPYLLKAVGIDPKLAKVWQTLSFDAERWGDFAAGREYMKKASEADPSSPDYAFYYASSLKEADSAQHHALMLSIPERFPGTERGAQALYWLAYRTGDPKVKTEVYELARKKYNPASSSWTSGAMLNYYDLLMERDVSKALELSGYMVSLDSLRDRDDWKKRKDIAGAVLASRALGKKGNYAEALKALNGVTLPRYSNTKEVLLIEKARIAAARGDHRAAYDSLLALYATDPTDQLMQQILPNASKLGKDGKAVQDDVWTLRKAASKPATAFSLDNYLTPGKSSLPALKGKVVLLTYWFPGCGPCRGEFPHFENVVRKFSKNELAYIGVNVVPEQDAYVAPFMKQSGYSFTPVRDDPDKRGNLTARGAPTNYLIDKEGNIVFANFRTNEHNERTLELMISELLDK